MTDERRPPRRPELLPQEEDVVFVPEDSPPVTQRAVPVPVPRYSRPVLRSIPDLDAQLSSVQQHLAKMALQQDHMSSIINQRFDLFHEELALTRHDVAETAKRVDELCELVKENHEPRLRKVESTAAQTVKLGGKYGGLLLLGSVVAEAFPQWGNLIRALLHGVP